MLTNVKPYVLGLLCCLISGCSLFEESGQTTVEGTVIDSATGQAVGPAQVAVFASRQSSFYSNFTQVGDWRDTDGQGHFSFSFDAQSNRDYIVRASSNRGETDYVSAPKLKGGRKNKNVRVPVVAPAWVAVQLQDAPPRSDAVNIYVWGFAQTVTIRPPLDTVLYRPVPAGDLNVVVWQLNGSRTVPNTETRIPYNVAGMDTFRIAIRY
ncbi:hypothetical protein [Hymenobacter metallilatus]|uniref:Carboxypeptidase regulatory-like domain-containing protein n=1 Tax=Hymenobacter metallilatus TaxID=2493666 RepID=A0A3R9MP35_9BACT|nr:hypothetical protein [Hymenobacter metallilatus]RSK37237.1 hypothetical protein EI290_00840 [Hymenobacter metallilatus]